MNSYKRKNNNNNVNIDRIISIGSLVVAIIAIIVSVCVGISSNNNAEKIAIKSGAYSKPEPMLYINDFQMPSSDETNIIFGCPTDTDSFVFLELPIIVKNQGEKSIEDLSVVLRYPNLGCKAIDTDLVKLDSFGLRGKIYTREKKQSVILIM